MRFQHQPVMLHEVISYMAPTEGKIMIDGTLGGAGHGREILKRLGSQGLLIGLDQDADAIAAARESLASVGFPYKTFRANYRDFDLFLDKLGISKVDGMLLDLGVSSFQLDEDERGFSYHKDAPLDMRMNQTEGLTAEMMVNTWSEEQLAYVIRFYGEERWAKRIAKFIVEAREKTPLRTTHELVDVIKRAIPKGAREGGPHPARRTFQGLRIAVNHELDVLGETLAKITNYLKPGGRLVVISFHSLEDRIVKKSLQKQAKSCICPPDFPVCRCGQMPEWRILTKKPLLPSSEEVANNPRARSAKLRGAEKI